VSLLQNLVFIKIKSFEKLSGDFLNLRDLLEKNYFLLSAKSLTKGELSTSSIVVIKSLNVIFF